MTHDQHTTDTPVPAADTNRAVAPTAAAATVTAAGIAFPAAAQTLSPKSTGVAGPGEFAGGVVEFDKTAIAGQETFLNFGCEVAKRNPATPDWKRANVYFERKVFGEKLRMPDGVEVDYWGFEDPLRGNGARPFPSPVIRVQEGDLVHVKLQTSKGPHTIHHHGIEPTTMNDGVGHVSMEVSGSYIYQWQPQHAGTWIYHCHVNTVLHFEMGLYGALIVDPAPDAAGKIRAFKNGPEYQVEKLWVFDDIDPRWHDLEHDAGLCGGDVGLNIFRPRYFFVSGIVNTRATTHSTVAVTAKRTDQVLIRMINAAYSVMRIQFDMDVEVISVDGHSLNKPWAKPYTIPRGEWFEMATATRYDIIIKPPYMARTGKARFQFTDWITKRVHGATSTNRLYVGYAETNINFV